MKRSMPLRPASGLASRLGHLLAILLLVLMAADAAAKDRVVYYHNDALGSPVAATGESGQVLWREDYAPYGKRLLDQDQGGNRLWYTGKEEDPSLGLQDFGARWYDPDIGRFLAIDSAGFNEANPQSFNRYTYANNNPYRYVDPDGRNPALFAVIGWMVGGAIISGGINAAMQDIDTGHVRWGGIGGVLDAAGDGAQLAPLGLVAGMKPTGSVANKTTKEVLTRKAPGRDGGYRSRLLSATLLGMLFPGRIRLRRMANLFINTKITLERKAEYVSSQMSGREPRQ